MTRRLLVLALSFGITAAPLAVTLCQVLCGAASATTARQHSCHTDAPTASETVAGVPHACGHNSEAPDSIEGSTPPPVALVAVLPAPPWAMLSVASGTAPNDPADRHPAGPPPRITQLRV